MLFMVIEKFPEGNLARVGERFREKGRMMPEGVTYVASWMADDGGRCFQIMDAESRDLLDEWIRNWEDLVEFEVSVVLTSADYWARATGGR